MTRNILITSCFDITGEKYGDVSYKGYKELSELCIESFEKNLRDDFEICILEGKTDSYHEMNKFIYSEIKEICKEYQCNILYVDSDTICIKPCNIFNKTDKFRMFDIRNEFQKNYPSIVPHEYYSHFPNWWMSNVRYYPHDMNDSVWDIGDSFYGKWIDIWAYECIIYNAMFYAQDIEEYDMNYYDPLYNCQYVEGQTDLKELKAAFIVHLQSTRGIDDAIRKAKELLK